ncbi:hypothetical protein TRFO_19801 [Tritrichomonas foetus]|uniref:Uncharacterized protein n=1 Tax=Tritrichomonas foetus TaxID=1144522 RepID=A0A1J4KN54_9EUKA|nr:hypothetical protein TRFO_19801 [Tritrichomonas foetus]|eukprot:OHT10821.1 hypothetical protein TRFO_19801 [Tritrichomonas foetus]
MFFVLFLPLCFSYTGFCYNPSITQCTCPSYLLEIPNFDDINESLINETDEIELFLCNDLTTAASLVLSSIVNDRILINSSLSSFIAVSFNEKSKKVRLNGVNVISIEKEIVLDEISIIQSNIFPAVFTESLLKGNRKIQNFIKGHSKNLLSNGNLSLKVNKIDCDIQSIANFYLIDTTHGVFDANTKISGELDHQILINLNPQNEESQNSLFCFYTLNGFFENCYLNVGIFSDVFTFDSGEIIFQKPPNVICQVNIIQTNYAVHLVATDESIFRFNLNKPYFIIDLISSDPFFMPDFDFYERIGNQFQINIKNDGVRLVLSKCHLSLNLINQHSPETDGIKASVYLDHQNIQIDSFKSQGNFELSIDGYISRSSNNVANYSLHIQETSINNFQLSKFVVLSNLITTTFTDLIVNAKLSNSTLYFQGQGDFYLSGSFELDTCQIDFTSLHLKDKAKISYNFLLSSPPLITCRNVVNDLFIPLEVNFFYCNDKVPQDETAASFINQARSVLFFKSFKKDDFYVHLDPYCRIDGFSESLSLVEFIFDEEQGNLSFYLIDFPSKVNSVICYGKECSNISFSEDVVINFDNSSSLSEKWTTRISSFTNSFSLYLLEELPEDFYFDFKFDLLTSLPRLSVTVISSSKHRFSIKADDSSGIDELVLYNVILDTPIKEVREWNFNWLLIEGGTEITENAAKYLNFEYIGYFGVDIYSYNFLKQKEVARSKILILQSGKKNCNIDYINSTTVIINDIIIEHDNRFQYYFQSDNIKVSKGNMHKIINLDNKEYLSENDVQLENHLNQFNVIDPMSLLSLNYYNKQSTRNDLEKVPTVHTKQTLANGDDGYFNINMYLFSTSYEGSLTIEGFWNESENPAISLFASSISILYVKTESENLPISFSIMTDMVVYLMPALNSTINNIYIHSPFMPSSQTFSIYCHDSISRVNINNSFCPFYTNTIVQFESEIFHVQNFTFLNDSACYLFGGTFENSIKIMPGSIASFTNSRLKQVKRMEFLFSDNHIPVLLIESKEDEIPQKIEINGDSGSIGEYPIIEGSSIMCSEVSERIDITSKTVETSNTTEKVTIKCGSEGEIIMVIGGHDDEKDNDKDNRRKLMIILIISISCLLAILIVTFVIIIYVKKKKNPVQLKEDLSTPLNSQSSAWQRF